MAQPSSSSVERNAIATPSWSLWQQVTTLPGRWPSTQFKSHQAELALLSRLPFFRPMEALEAYLPSPESTSVKRIRSSRWFGALWRAESCSSLSSAKNTTASASQRSLATSAASALDAKHNHSNQDENALVGRVGSVNIGQDHFIRTLVIDRETRFMQPLSTSDAVPLVCTHGFGTGLGIFYRNYEALAQTSGRRIYSIDWLGMGLSARPSKLPWLRRSWRAEFGPEFDQDQLSQTESFFVESLEHWRQTMGISKMVLLGHSFGGYMSALYALRYPQHVDKLILVSPMGLLGAPSGFFPWLENVNNGIINAPPKGMFEKRSTPPIWQPGQHRSQWVQPATIPPPLAEMLEPSPKSSDHLSAEGVPDAPPSPAAVPSTTNGADDKPAVTPLRDRQMVVRVLLQTWKWQMSPQWLVRYAGPMGPWLVHKYTERYTFLDKEDQVRLTDYLYHLSSRPGSGEYALTVLTHPFVFAKLPLVDRLHALQVPTLFIYGESDWMDYRGAERVAKCMQAPSRIIHIADAGHNMMLENPQDFNAALLEELE
ncbi:hypothetical protein H4R35_001643 [Dimargaris xerosporica]|nr:hypothetical protein H4R35_001643 [Dimargaris xerosporica]